MATYVMDISKSDSFILSYTSRQGESGETLYFSLFDDGSRVNTSEIKSAMLNMETPLGHIINQVVQNDGSRFRFTTTENMNSEVGYFKRVYLELTYLSGIVKTTPDLIYYVLPSVNFNSGSSSDYIDRVESVITKAQDAYNSYMRTLDQAYTEYTEALKQEVIDTLDQLNNSIPSFATEEYVDNQVGDIESALDAILGV